MPRIVPDFTAGLVQLRASCAMGAECTCALRIEATGDVDELAYLLDGSPVMLTFGLPVLALADLMMGMLIVSNMNQSGSLHDLPQLEDTDLLDEDRSLFGEDLLDDEESPDGMLDGLSDDEVVRLFVGDIDLADPSAEAMAGLRRLAEPPFELVSINDDGPEPELYGQLPEHVLQPA